MKKVIAQLVDSAGNIPRDILKRYNIVEVPLHFTFDGKEHFRENVDLSNCQFYQRMKNNPQQIPRTATPSINEWYDAFENFYKKGYQQFIVTTIARNLSASFQSAVMAQDIFVKEHPDAEIKVLESNTCACGQAALEIKIAHLIEQGQLTLDELVQKIKALIPHVVSLFSVNELTYMRAGGRIGGATAFLGKLINIKPVCEFINGTVHPIKAVRGRQKALTALVDEAVRRIKNAENTVICVQHAICEEDARYMIGRLKEKLNYQGEIYQGMVGATVGAHSGPGAIGIGIIED